MSISLSLFFTLLLYISATFGQEVGRILTRVACENRDMVVKCPAGLVLDIIDADYGRTVHTICNIGNESVNVTDCRTNNAVEVIRNMCQGQPSCIYLVTNDLFGDPCNGINKFAVIKFQCTEFRSNITDEGCKENDYMCSNGRCVAQNKVCDGEIDCLQGEDERDCDCREGEFKCNNGRCLPQNFVCNGEGDCLNGEDERDCPFRCKEEEFQCGESNRCVPITSKCNSLEECPEGEDELDCLYSGMKRFVEMLSASTLPPIYTPFSPPPPILPTYATTSNPFPAHNDYKNHYHPAAQTPFFYGYPQPQYNSNDRNVNLFHY